MQLIVIVFAIVVSNSMPDLTESTKPQIHKSHSAPQLVHGATKGFNPFTAKAADQRDHFGRDTPEQHFEPDEPQEFGVRFVDRATLATLEQVGSSMSEQPQSHSQQSDVLHPLNTDIKDYNEPGTPPQGSQNAVNSIYE